MTRIAIAGAGALGSVYGGLLSAAGNDVVLLAHGAHEQALRDSPLALTLPTGSRTIAVGLADSAEADVVILTAKAFDSAAVLARVRGTPQLALSVQNGPGKNEQLEARFGAGSLVGAVSTIGAELTAPGAVRSALGVTYVGELDGRPSERLAQLSQILNRAGLETREVDDARSVEWSKLAQVSAVMAVQVVTGFYVHALLQLPETASLVKTIVEEVAALAAALEIEVADWPLAFPVASVARAGRAEGLELLQQAGKRLEERGVTSMRTSAMQSLAARKPTELDAIHGEIVRQAQRAGVSATATEICCRLGRRAELSGGTVNVPESGAEQTRARRLAERISDAVSEQAISKTTERPL